MDASSAVGTWGRRAALVAWLAAGLATLATAPAGAHGPGPIPENPAWKQYVLGTGKPDAAPVRVVSTSGAVTNAQGLVHRSRRPTTLTYAPGRPAPTIVLDYGREVGGLPFFDVGSDRSGRRCHVGLAARGLQRDAPVPLVLRQLHAFGRRGRRRHEPQARQRGELRRRRDARRSTTRRPRSRRSGRNRAARHCSPPPRRETRTSRWRPPPGSLPATRCGSTPPARRSR